jgi:hypothetical protein
MASGEVINLAEERHVVRYREAVAEIYERHAAALDAGVTPLKADAEVVEAYDAWAALEGVGRTHLCPMNHLVVLAALKSRTANRG